MLAAKLIAEAYNDIYCKIAPSPIHGVGVFAIKDIPPNTIILKRVTEYAKVDSKFLKRIDSNVAELYKSLLQQTDNFIFIPVNGFSSIDMSFYVNHSTTPNARYDIENYFIVSKNRILIGEEITFDYRVLANDLIS
jgi:SET domain-containing protein